MASALAALRQSPEAPLLVSLLAASSRHREGVIQLLSAEKPVLKAMLAPGRLSDLGSRVLAVLESAAAEQPMAGAAAAPRVAALSGAVPSYCVVVVLPASLAPPSELLLPAAPSYTIATLAALLEERTGAPADRMVLTKLPDSRRRGATSTRLEDMDATMETAGLGAGSKIVLSFTDGPVISRAPGFAPPEAIFLRIKHLHDHFPPVDFKAEASWTPRRLMLEVFRQHGRWAPSDTALLLGVTKAGDGHFTYNTALSVWPDICHGANTSSLRAVVQSHLSGGKGLDPRAPIEVYLNRDFAPTNRRRRRRRNERHLSRNAAVHQLFAAFANRAAAFDLPLHVGLISFGSEIRVMSRVTPLFERFIAAVNRTSPEGDTALWDALTAGVDMAAQAFPGVTPMRRRVLVLTDGEDSCSTGSASAVVRRARDSGVVIDAITLGDAATVEAGGMLRAVTHATNGLCFAPATLRDALKQVELETVLSSGERPATPALPDWMPRRTAPGTDSALLAAHGSRGTLFVRADNVPPQRADPALSLPALAATAALHTYDSADAAAANAPAPAPVPGSTAPPPAEAGARPHDGMRKLAQELRAVTSEEVMGAEFLATYDVYPCADDLAFWRFVMSGRSETPYANGTFLLSVRFPPTYPALPPAVRFETPVLHPNVNAYGRICSALLSSEWSAGGGGRPLMPYVLRMIYSLFSSPETANPLNSALALDFYTAGGVYEVQVAEHVEAHATHKDRDQWRQELLGDDDA